MCLHFISGAKRVKIRTLGDLSGRVQIRTANEALDFVRLRTSARASPLFESVRPSPGIDVLDRSRVTLDTVYGDPYFLKVLKEMPEGVLGVVEHRTYVKLGFPPATAARVGEQFLVSRPVLHVTPDRAPHYRAPQYDVLVVQQSVTASGKIVTLNAAEFPRSRVRAVPWDLIPFG